MVEWFWRYWVDRFEHTENTSSKLTSTDILHLHCDTDLEHSNPILPQDTPAYDAVLSNKVWLQTDQQFRRCRRHSQTLTLNTVNQFFCMTLSLMMLHNHTRFGDKCSMVQKIFSRQTFTNIFNLCCVLDHECSNPVFPQDTQAYDALL